MVKKQKLCKCGCGGYASPGKDYIRGHHVRVNNPMKNPEIVKKNIKSRKDHINDPKPESKLCKCGCGGYTEPGNDYIHGHARKGIKLSDETRKNQRIAQAKRWKDPEEHDVASKAQKKHHDEHPERGEKTGLSIKKFYEEHPEKREEMAERQTEKYSDPLEREKAREYQKEYWTNEENLILHSCKQLGITRDEWTNFSCESLYCSDFNENRRESNREKYGRRCFICNKLESENIDKNGKIRKLSVHHVDNNKNQGCDGIPWKLVPLCMACHTGAHTEEWEARITWLIKNIWI